MPYLDVPPLNAFSKRFWSNVQFTPKDFFSGLFVSDDNFCDPSFLAV